MNRAKVVVLLKEQPRNANQIAQSLGMDYKTTRHHLRVLSKNRMITESGEGYGALYFISPELEQSFDEFLKIWERMGSK
jgi:DNA-binding transcriptional ArsR family regulator